MNYKQKKLWEDLEERGEVITWWHAGFFPSGRKKLVKLDKKFYIMGHDGTGNYYYFRPFVDPIPKDEVKDILADKTDFTTSEIDKIVGDV